jgi:hypothetical protein
METEGCTFSVTAVDLDRNQDLTVSWYFDDEPVFIGNPYIYASDDNYASAGVHEVRADVSDGELTTSKEWELTVENLNRLPQAVIDAPVSGAEFMEGESIHFSAASSSDPDGETLSYGWSEGGQNVSDQVEFDRPFAPGLHTVTLEVRDGAGGVATAAVRFRVRYVEISVLVGLDRFEVRAGDKVEIIVTMSNIGDANATDLALDVSVDGVSVGSSTVTGLKAGGAERELYTWKAAKGTHTIVARVGDRTWTREVTVGAASGAVTTGGIGDYVWPAAMIAVIVVLAAFGAMALGRKGRP